MTRAAIGKTVVVCRDIYAYLSHPSIAVLKNGDWLAAFKHTRRSVKIMHPPDDPLYRTLVCRSRDRGESWGKAWFAPDFEWYGTNCPGLTCLRDGTVVMGEFRFAWYPIGDAKRRRAAGEWIAINTVRQEWVTEFDEADWERTINPWAKGVRGAYAHISRDQGETFDRTVEIACAPYTPGATRTGAIELADGRLTWALNEVGLGPESPQAVYCLTARNGGLDWEPPTLIAANPDRVFSEPCLLELSSNRLLCVLRHTPEHRLYTARSDDGGRTWSEPVRTPMDGLPGHVIRLANGRLLCSYGRRKAPFGIRAMLSSDDGASWDADGEIVIRADFANGNLGYATAIEYEPGRLFVIYYGEDSECVTHIQGTYLDL